MKKVNYKSGALHFKIINARGDEDFVPCKVLMSTAKSNMYKVLNHDSFILFIFCLNYFCFTTSTIQIHQPCKEIQKKVPKKQKRTWTYEDENGNDLGQDYREILQSSGNQQIENQKKLDNDIVRIRCNNCCKQSVYCVTILFLCLE